VGVIVNTALPFFALILCGYLAVRLRVLDAAAARGLNAFVFWLALPALLLASVAASALADLLDGRFLAVFYGVNGLLYVTTFLVARLAWGDGAGLAALRSLGVIWGNYGYLGLPLLTAALGPAAALPTVAVITCDILVPATLTIALLERDRGGGKGPRRPGLGARPASPATRSSSPSWTGASSRPAASRADRAYRLPEAPGQRRRPVRPGGARRLAGPVALRRRPTRRVLVDRAQAARQPAPGLARRQPPPAARARQARRRRPAGRHAHRRQRLRHRPALRDLGLRASTSVLVTHLGSVATLAALLYALGR
jgi:predicted permease